MIAYPILFFKKTTSKLVYTHGLLTHLRIPSFRISIQNSLQDAYLCYNKIYSTHQYYFELRQDVRAQIYRFYYCLHIHTSRYTLRQKHIGRFRFSAIFCFPGLEIRNNSSRHTHLQRNHLQRLTQKRPDTYRLLHLCEFHIFSSLFRFPDYMT